jgi:hypothetical protein
MANVLEIPQQLCIPLGAGLQTCVTLPVPPFQPVEPPNNVLVIPVKQPPPPPPWNPLVQLQLTVEGCETFVRGPSYDTPSCNIDTQLGQCSAATQYKWYYDHQIDPLTGIPGPVGPPRHLILQNTVTGEVLEDTDPSGSWADNCPNSTTVILLNPPPTQPPPSFCNGFGCSLIGGLCVCDPPIPDPIPTHTPFQSWARFLKRLGTGAGGPTGKASVNASVSTNQVLPAETELRTDEGRDVAAIREEFAQNFLLLDPSRRKGLPYMPKKCACGEGEGDEVELIE